MQNLEMQKQLAEGKALDVRRVGKPVAEGVFSLKSYDPNKDYCDSMTERWIWSIGQNVFDNRIEAAGDSRYYQDRNWSCLFLR